MYVNVTFCLILTIILYEQAEPGQSCYRKKPVSLSPAGKIRYFNGLFSIFECFFQMSSSERSVINDVLMISHCLSLTSKVK